MVALAGRGLWLQRACVCHKPPRVLAFPACTASQGNGLGLDRGGSGAAPGGLRALAGASVPGELAAGSFGRGT